MPLLSIAALREQIASRATAPLYMLVGDDDAEKDVVAHEFLETVDEGLRAFNTERLYGGETTVNVLIESASTFPMMAPRRIVILLEAEKLLVPKRESKAADEAQERLIGFIADPPAHATVVFVCGPVDSRRQAVKRLIKEAQVVDCGTIADAAEAERWIKARAAKAGVSIEPGAVRVLVERAGNDVVRLRAGFDRVTLYALGQRSISADDVRQAVAAGPEAQEDFGIAKAVWRNDAAAALRELALALEAGAVPVMVMGQLRAAAEKLPANRLGAAIDAVFRTDLALKSSGGEPKILLERLVVELCESRRPAFTPRGGRV